MELDRQGGGPARAAGTLPVVPGAFGQPFRWQENRGSAFAELVLTLPLLVGLLMAILLLSQALATKMAVMSAARLAARQYAVTGNATAAEAVAREEMKDAGFDPSRVQVQVSGQEFLTVTVTYRLPLPFAGSTLPGLSSEWAIPGRAMFRQGG
ncbi:MAG: pilus assembly protein [Firmicutes bacterium]|nr:pilus assembly protein [Bacillota bacterium]